MAALYRETGDASATEFARRLAETLGGNGFLENDDLARRRDERHRAFAQSERREPLLAGEAYPEDAGALRSLLDGWLGSADERTVPDGVFAIAAPHVSFEGGFRCYASAYRALPPDAGERTFVVLGTSHYGAAERFGLTRKDFVTPLGVARTDAPARGPARARGRRRGRARGLLPRGRALDRVPGDLPAAPVRPGRACRADPVRSVRPGDAGRRPPRRRSRRRALPGRARGAATRARAAGSRGCSASTWRTSADATGTISSRARARGRSPRSRRAIAGASRRSSPATRTASGRRSARTRTTSSWCGASPLYAFLKATAPKRGALLRYEQWNIDPASVVSFAALAFGRDAAHAGRGRRRMRGLVHGLALVALTVASLSAAGAAETPRSTAQDSRPASETQPVAIVASETIGAAELDALIRPQLADLRAQEQQLRLQAVEVLISRALIRKEAAAAASACRRWSKAEIADKAVVSEADGEGVLRCQQGPLRLDAGSRRDQADAAGSRAAASRRATRRLHARAAGEVRRQGPARALPRPGRARRGPDPRQRRTRR